MDKFAMCNKSPYH